MKLSLIVMLLIFTSPAAFAYVGPGLGLGVLGALFGILAAVVLAIVGLFWYPIKRLLGKKNLAEDQPNKEEAQ